MEEKKVQNIAELNDEHLEQVSGGADSSGVQTQATVCPKCGKSSGIVLMAVVFQCPYCGYQDDDAYVM